MRETDQYSTTNADRARKLVTRLIAILMTLSLIYAFSYAPVLSMTMKPTRVAVFDYPLRTVIEPVPDPSWERFYKPVQALSDRSPLARAPLLWWAECWGVREWVDPPKPATFDP